MQQCILAVRGEHFDGWHIYLANTQSLRTLMLLAETGLVKETRSINGSSFPSGPFAPLPQVSSARHLVVRREHFDGGHIYLANTQSLRTLMLQAETGLVKETRSIIGSSSPLGPFAPIPQVGSARHSGCKRGAF